ncbi:MAG: AzlD domain-containing protein [Candidatus Colwellbacteria bacterium]|nr:AzlD domain-containing protein [Candidatus Colwellbacteria bacterium]
MKREKNKSPRMQTNADGTQTDADNFPRKSASSQRESAIQWQAPEFEYNPKDVSWYWLSLIAAIILIAFSLWQKNFLFAIFVAIAWFIILNWANRFPTIWEFRIDDKGIDINLPSKKTVSKFYAYTEIEGFDIHIGGEEYKELVFRVKSKFSPFLKINFLSADEEKIKNFLTQFLPKKEFSESVADSLSKLVRF